MASEQEIKNIDNQILLIKNNSEYKRLTTSHRGPQDDQRLKVYTLQLQTLELKKNNLLQNKISSSSTPVSRGRSDSIKKPVPIVRSSAPQPQAPQPAVIRQDNKIVKKVVQDLVAPLTTKPRLKPVAKKEEKKTQVASKVKKEVPKDLPKKFDSNDQLDLDTINTLDDLIN